MSKDIKCPKCGSEDIYYSKKNDAECCCMKCLSPFLYISKPMTDEQIAKLKNEIDKAETHLDPYPQARGFDVGNDQYTAPRPLPCVRDEHGEIMNQTVKDLVAKIDSELTELKWELAAYPSNYVAFYYAESVRPVEWVRIADEAADTITAITTLLEALGVDVKARDDAQRRVNNKNRERGRL